MTFKKIGTAFLIIAISFSMELLREETFGRVSRYLQQSGFLSNSIFEASKMYAYPVPVFYQVTANAQGNGSGSISGNLSGDNLNATWNGSALVGDNTATVSEGSGPYTISAVANPGSNASWSGCDGVSGNGTTLANCTLNLVTANKTVSSSFSLLSANYNYLPLILNQYQAIHYSSNLLSDKSAILGGVEKLRSLLELKMSRERSLPIWLLMLHLHHPLEEVLIRYQYF